MLQTLRNAWKIEEIRKKILFTLLIILLYRLGNAIPVPYVNIAALQSYFTVLQNTVLGLLDVMSGGAFSNATIFARPSSRISTPPSYPAPVLRSGTRAYEQG